MGVDVTVVQRILNHTPQGVTFIYVRHSYEPEMRAAWGEWLVRLKG